MNEQRFKQNYVRRKEKDQPLNDRAVGWSHRKTERGRPRMNAQRSTLTMSEEQKQEQKDTRALRFACIAVGVAASLLGMRFILGQTGALYGALAGAGGVILGSLLFSFVSRFRG